MLIDSHTHLDHSEEDAESLVREARQAGVGLIVQSGINLASSQYSVKAAERYQEVFATVGFHPQESGKLDDEQMAGIEELTAHPRVVAVGETGFDFCHDYWPHQQQEDVFLRHLDLARRAGLPVVIHTRDADDATLAVLAEHASDLTVILHCFSLPQSLDEVVARGYYTSFAGNVTYKNAVPLQEAARAVPEHLLLMETDAPWLTPVPFRGKRNRPALVAHVYDFVAALRRVRVDELAEQVEANARRAFPGWPSRAGVEHGDGVPTPDAGSRTRQTSLARLAEFGITPKRDLGQNFLIDDNILGVILAQLECDPNDVILEVGAGLGVLTDALAAVSRHVHAFEVDRSLEAALVATLGDALTVESRVSLHFQDVLRAPLEELDPSPTLCASNLPYSIAGPFIVESLQRLPGVRRYCVMVQREVAERIAAAPGSKTYGILSVWVQLYARVVRSRPLSRSIFYPQPHVDSSLLVLDRLPGGRLPACDPVLLKAVIQAAFGQRRKTLANALAAGLDLPRERALALVEAAGAPAAVRAERLTPGQFVKLAELISGN